MPVSCLWLPQPSLTSLPPHPERHSQTKAPGSATPNSPEGVEGGTGSSGPQVLFFQKRCVLLLSHLYSKFCMSFPHLPWHEQDGRPASNCFDSQEQCQLCLREHRLHFHVHHPANTIKMPVKHRKKILKNLRWVKRQELPE